MRREVVMVVRFCMTVFLRSEYVAMWRLGEEPAAMRMAGKGIEVGEICH
jgi:hypothetical protein